MSAVDRDPFILDRPTGGRLSARDAVVCVFIAALLLVLLQGESIRSTGEKMDPGWQRTLVLAVGEPAGWLADRLPLADAADDVLAFLSPDDDLSGEGGFNAAPVAGPAAAAGGGTSGAASVPITTDSFDPTELGVKTEKLPQLKTLLVTGDSLAQPLDVQLARRLAGDGVQTVREAHLGTGVSKTGFIDWGAESTRQAKERKPEAVVMFMGANEGFPFPGADGKSIQCCGPEWAVVYATRARRMMDNYRRDGAARVYWLTLPLPRDREAQAIARTVNAAIEVAAQPLRSQVRVLDMASVFTPEGRYRAAQDIGGRKTIVRRPDGVHLNDAGSNVAMGLVLERLRADFAKLGS
ncbi:MAG TPA: GDSL-type esterase/lipase family protein [Solirubrobacteraceae bacterium]|nr:GDSL-type esterase/lipase family protein [Solirubrobacteraceae bacterium]